MMEVTNSEKNITPFGGINFIYRAIEQLGLPSFLDSELGTRSIFAKYSYSDIVLSLLGNSLTQGSFLADISLLKEKLRGQTFVKIPSADTVEYVCQQLKQATDIVTTKDGVVHYLNYDNNLNGLLVKLAVKCKQLKPFQTQGYTLDYDNVVIENDKQDAQFSYKKTRGYHPGFAFIGRIPVHIENRNGNTPARYGQMQILERCLSNLKKEAVPVAAFRGDNASYQKGVIEMIDGHNIRFYIRMRDFKGIREQFARLPNWETVYINGHKKAVASMEYSFEKSDKPFRIVVTRSIKKDKQLDIFEGRAYHYQAIITNDQLKKEQAVIEFYNQRADSEKSNCYLLNDFNLNHLPFMDMDTNTVYMYLMAMCATIFEWIKVVLANNQIPGISLSMRVKNIFFRYIAVAATWVYHAHKTILKVFSSKHYKVLQI